MAVLYVEQDVNFILFYLAIMLRSSKLKNKPENLYLKK